MNRETYDGKGNLIFTEEIEDVSITPSEQDILLYIVQKKPDITDKDKEQARFDLMSK